MSGSTSSIQVMVEKRHPSLFGKLCSYAFWGWQALMGAWFLYATFATGSVANQATSQAGQIGAAIGGTIAITLIFGLWLFGSLILGLMKFFTRGEKTIEMRTA